MYIKHRAFTFSAVSSLSIPLLPICIKKKYAILVFILFALTFLLHVQCRAAGIIDHQGINAFYGNSSWTNIGPDPENRYTWFNISYLLGGDINPWLSLETSLGPGYIETADNNTSGSLEWRLLLDMHYKYLYLKLGAGIAYLFEAENISELSDSEFFSIISCRLGLRYRFDKAGKYQPVIMLGYAVEHLSDPFKNGQEGDTGLNAGAIEATISWNF